MAGELNVGTGPSGSVLVDGALMTFGYWKLDPTYGAAVYATFGDGGFDHNCRSRNKAELKLRAPKTPTMVLTGGTLYTFTLNVCVTEDGDAISLPALDARIIGSPIEVDSAEEKKVIEIEYTAMVSGPFTLTV